MAEFDPNASRDPAQPFREKSRVITPECRFSFVHVFKPYANPKNRDQTPKYSVCAIFAPGANLNRMKLAAKHVGVEKWGPNFEELLRAGQLKNPFNSNSKRAGQDGFPAGGVYVNMGRYPEYGPPGLVGPDGKTKIINSEQFFSGCYGYAICNAYVYDNSGNRGISFGLDGIQVSRLGPRLDNQINPEEFFTPLPGADSFGSGTSDEDIPF